jgi:alanyl-tRNA synthetase
MIRQISQTFEKQKDLVRAVQEMLGENSKLAKQVERFRKNVQSVIVKNLVDGMQMLGEIRYISARVDVDDASQLREISFQLRDKVKLLCAVLAAEIGGKAHLSVMLTDDLRDTYSLDAVAMIREISKPIQGGGGGQPFFATAGGKDPAGIDAALEMARKLITGTSIE